MKTAGKVIIAVVVTAGIVIGAGAFAHRKGFCYDCEPQERVEHISDFIGYKLDLNDAQSEKLSALVTRLMAIRSEMHENRDVTKQELVEIISAPKLDQARVLALVQEKTAMVEARAPEVIAALAEFSDSLDASQKQEITDMLARKMDHHHH